MAAGSLILGGNMSIAVGPLGRNREATSSINLSGKVVAMYELILVHLYPTLVLLILFILGTAI